MATPGPGTPMATRPPTLVRSALLPSVLVVALALTPVVDALSPRTSVRASVKVDPEADASSLLPTWPAGSDDPCVYAVQNPFNTGTLLGKDCKSYVCVQRVLMHSAGCSVDVNPEGTQLQFAILWGPTSLVDWRFGAQALNEPELNQVVRCPGWAGAGSPIPAAPLTLPPCVIDVPWAGSSRASVVFEVPINSPAAGTYAIYVGAPVF